MNCKLFNALDILGKKWTIPLLQEIQLNGGGFNSLQLSLKKISSKVLAERLSTLQNLELIHKQNQDLRTFYTLTEQGLALIKVIQPLREWNSTYCHDNCKNNRCTTCELY